MELNYKLTEEAYIDFNIYHAKNSPAVKRQLTIQRILVPIIYLLLAVIGSAVLDLPFYVLFIPMLILGALWFLFYPVYFYRLIKRNSKKMLREGKNAVFLGEHSMFLTEEGLREVNPKGEMALSWSGIETLGEDQSNFYLYNSGMSALIIPKAGLENKVEVSSFLQGKIGR